MTILIYALIGMSSFFFVLVPISGGIVLNPLLSLIVEPHVAISLTVFFFTLNSGIKALIFRHDIVHKYVVQMLPISLVMAVVGTFVIGFIPETLLYFLMLLMTVFFVIKKVKPALFERNKSDTKQGVKKKNLGFVLTAIMTGFMQGTGLGGGGSLRKVYFLAKNLSLQQMHGTTSALSVVLGLVSILIRLETNQITPEVLLPILYLIPIMLISIVYGKKVLIKLNERTSEIIIKATLTLTIAFLTLKLL